MNIDIIGIPDVDRIWAQVVGDVARCLSKAPMEIGAGDIWTKCRSGEWLLIIAHDGEKIHGTTIWRFTAHGYLECVLLVGDRRGEWFPSLVEVAEGIAKAHGCRGLVASGRKGLIDMIKKLRPAAKVPRSTFVLEF